MTQHSFEDPILNLAEAAIYISMSQSFTASHATRKGVSPRLASIKIGNRLKFRKSALDAFVQEYATKKD